MSQHAARAILAADIQHLIVLRLLTKQQSVAPRLTRKASLLYLRMDRGAALAPISARCDTPAGDPDYRPSPYDAHDFAGRPNPLCNSIVKRSLPGTLAVAGASTSQRRPSGHPPGSRIRPVSGTANCACPPGTDHVAWRRSATGWLSVEGSQQALPHLLTRTCDRRERPVLRARQRSIRLASRSLCARS